MAAEGTGTVGKALSLLPLVGQHPQGATAAQIAEKVDYPFSTVHRLLTTLVGTKFLTYDSKERRYHLGLPIFQLAQQVAQGRGFQGTATPILEGLTAATGESSLLSVLDRDQQLTVHKVDGPQFRTTTDPGDRGPLHTSAVGKVLLAFADPTARQHLLETIELTPRTEHSISSREDLRREIERVRAQGWAGQSEENDIGMTALAVPVLSPAGGLIGAVALAAPLFRTNLKGLEHYLPELRQAAHQLSVQLPSR